MIRLGLLVLFTVLLLCAHSFAAPTAIGTWKQMKARGSIPVERPYASCALFQNHLYVYGGRTGVATWSQSIHKYNLDRNSWSISSLQPANTQSKLPKLAGHSFTQISDNEYLVFGGRTGIFSYTSDVYHVNLQEETSQLLTPSSSVKPQPRWEHAAAFHDRKLYSFGGAAKESFNDIFSFDLDKKEWKEVTPKGEKLPSIHGHSVTIVENKAYIIGGYMSDDTFNKDVYIYDIEHNMMSKKTKTGLKPRAFHTSSLIGNYIYVVGGIHSNSHLVDQVDIFHTLKDHTVNYPIGGKFPARKNHCAAVDAEGKRVVVFGGISSNRWGAGSNRNDVVILDTSANQRKESNAPLPQRLTAIILDINSEITNKQNYTDQTPIEKQLQHEIEKDEIDQFNDIPNRIADCKEIEQLYHEVVNNEANRRDIVIQSKMHIQETQKLSDALIHLRQQLGEGSVLSEEKLKNLTKLEHELSESQQRHDQAKQGEFHSRSDRDRSKEAIAKIGNEISTLKARVGSFEQKRDSDTENLRIYNNMLKNSDANFEKKQEEEGLVLEKLKVLKVSLGNVTDDKENLRQKILELQEVIREIESHLNTLDSLPIDQMRLLYNTGDKALKELINMFSIVLKVMDKKDMEPINTDLDQLNPDRIAIRIEKQKIEVEQRLEEKKKELQKLKDQLAALNQNLTSVEQEISNWERRRSEIEKEINQINSLKTDSDQKRADLEARIKSSEDRVKAIEVEITKKQKAVKGHRNTIKKSEKEEKMYSAKKEKEGALEATLQKKVRQLRDELEDHDSELRRKFQEAVDTQKELNDLRSNISMSKQIFDSQSSSVKKARERLKEKLRVAEGRCSACEADKAALEKELEMTKKELAKLQEELKAKQNKSK